MTLVRIIKNWDYPDLLRQTPDSLGRWEQIQFTCDDVEEADYVIILNGSLCNLEVKCVPENIWIIVQEPPTNDVKNWHFIPNHCNKMFTSDESKVGKNYVHSHPALPWHVNKTYNELLSYSTPIKSQNISWITSNKTFYDGHKKRLLFMEKLKNILDFDLYGKGFKEIPDKWTALTPYKYSFAIENFSNQYYWSEKIADCFLSWTMPIYYGCKNITHYFPKESLIQIDIDSDTVIEDIKLALSEKRWEKSLDAISYARPLVLNNYQLFPFITSHIISSENRRGAFHKPQKVVIPNQLESLSNGSFNWANILKQFKI